MSTEPAEPTGREEEWSAVLVACLEALDRGAVKDRQELVARYPEFAPQLARFLAGDERLDHWTAPLREAARTSATVSAAAEATAGTEGHGPGPQVPRAFGDYELLEEVGRGGMGVVYRGRQKRLNRVVALKVFATDLPAPDAERQRFRNEAELVAHLDHPHIVPIYEVGEHDGRPYFSMKLLEGGS